MTIVSVMNYAYLSKYWSLEDIDCAPIVFRSPAQYAYWRSTRVSLLQHDLSLGLAYLSSVNAAI